MNSKSVIRVKSKAKKPIEFRMVVIGNPLVVATFCDNLGLGFNPRFRINEKITAVVSTENDNEPSVSQSAVSQSQVKVKPKPANQEYDMVVCCAGAAAAVSSYDLMSEANYNAVFVQASDQPQHRPVHPRWKPNTVVPYAEDSKYHEDAVPQITTALVSAGWGAIAAYRLDHEDNEKAQFFNHAWTTYSQQLQLMKATDTILANDTSLPKVLVPLVRQYLFFGKMTKQTLDTRLAAIQDSEREEEPEAEDKPKKRWWLLCG